MGWVVPADTHMEDKDAELGLGGIGAHLEPGDLDVLLQLLDGVLERGAGVVDLVDDQDALADQVGHGAEAGQIEPLGASDLGAGLLFDVVSRQALVEREADGLDRDVGRAGLLEERPQDACRHVATAADGDHELRLEPLQDRARGFLAELVHLLEGNKRHPGSATWGGRLRERGAVRVVCRATKRMSWHAHREREGPLARGGGAMARVETVYLTSL